MTRVEQLIEQLNTVHHHNIRRITELIEVIPKEVLNSDNTKGWMEYGNDIILSAALLSNLPSIAYHDADRLHMVVLLPTFLFTPITQAFHNIYKC